jgi:glycogen operon protein
MMLAGDEFGRTQGGNNNAYCQDNEISWIDWDGRSEEDLRFLAFVQRLVNFRKNCSFIRSGEFLRMGGETIEWLAYDGRQMTTPDWVSPYTHCFGLQFAVAAAGERGPRRGLILFNASHAEVTFNLPAASPRCRWEILSNTADENGNGESTLVSPTILLPPRSLLLLQEALISERTSHGSG